MPWSVDLAVASCQLFSMSLFRRKSTIRRFHRGEIVRSKIDSGSMVADSENHEYEVTCWFFHFDDLMIVNFAREGLSLQEQAPREAPRFNGKRAEFPVL